MPRSSLSAGSAKSLDDVSVFHFASSYVRAVSGMAGTLRNVDDTASDLHYSLVLDMETTVEQIAQRGANDISRI